MEPVKTLLISNHESDYILIRSIVNQFPDKDKFLFSWVSTYEQAILSISRRQHDLYFADYNLGRSNALDLLAEIKNFDCKEPVIILHEEKERSIEEKVIRAGAADFLLKNEIDAPVLAKSIRHALIRGESLKALKESEQKYKMIFEKSRDLVLIADIAGKVYDLNLAGLNFFGYRITEIQGLTDRDIFVQADDREQFIQLLELNGSVTDFECELCSKDGGVHFCSISAFIQLSAHGLEETYHAIIRDLTKRRRMEAHIIRADKMALSAHIAKGLAAEIRNPLTNMSLALQEALAVTAASENKPLKNCLEIIGLNFTRVNKLVENFIISTEITSLNMTPCNMAEVIQEALAEIEHRLAAEKITVQKEILLTNVKVTLDKDKIRKALTDIFENAIEAMSVSPKILNITTFLDNGNYTVLIEDNGKGIEADNQHKIFEPFFSTKASDGLGLTNVQRVLIAHKGSIQCKPQAGGSLFVIQIPLETETGYWGN